MAYESMIFLSLMFDLIHEEIIDDLQVEKRKILSDERLETDVCIYVDRINY